MISSSDEFQSSKVSKQYVNVSVRQYDIAFLYCENVMGPMRI